MFKRFKELTVNAGYACEENNAGFMPNYAQQRKNKKDVVWIVVLSVMLCVQVAVLGVLIAYDRTTTRAKSTAVVSATSSEGAATVKEDDYDIEVPSEAVANKGNVFERYKTPLSELDTSADYKNLCSALAKYAGTDKAIITCDQGVQVVEIGGKYVATDSVCNTYWVWAENSSETISKYIDILYCPVMCTSAANVKQGDIVPEKWVYKSVRLTKETEEQLGYTCEEIEKIYLYRFNHLAGNESQNEKFPVEDAIKAASRE